jgi:Hemerythrin HHE cation binding domain
MMPDTFEILKRNNHEIRQVLAGLQQGAGSQHPSRSELSAHRHLIDQLMTMASRQEAAEERLLASAIGRLGPQAARVVGQAISQSRMIRRTLAQLAAAPDSDPETAGQVSAVATAWREHFDFEEQQVLPLLRQAGERAAATQAEAGGIRDSATGALSRLRDAATSHDAPGPAAGQASG